jgi:sigma-B regulation protein RsbU (phosphoserine phosphatase)
MIPQLAPVVALPDAARIAADLRLIVGASVLGTMAFAALALFSLRRRSADLALMSFATFALLYAVRLLALTWTVPDLLGGSDVLWLYVRAMLTYVMPIPLLVFARQLLGPGPYGLRTYLLWINILFAVVAIPGSLLAHNPWWAGSANSILIILMLPGIGIGLFKWDGGRVTPATKLIGVSIVVVAFFVLAENLKSMRLIRWPSDIEFIGFIVLAISLVYSVTERFLADEGRLVAIDRELETARQIQQSILPRDVPSGDGFRVSVRYLPMTAVAGDFYDFFLTADGAPGVLVADVSGHGVPAALIASMVKIAASSHKEDIVDPGRLLTRMNRTLDGQLGGQFVTAISVYLDRRAGVAACAGAGHPPILHWRAGTRTLERIDSTGMMLGLLPAAEFGTHRQPFASGDRLLLYTDGLSEATSVTAAATAPATANEEMFGDERFPAIVREHASRPGAELADIILADLTRWSGRVTGFDDDVTLVIVDVV